MVQIVALVNDTNKGDSDNAHAVQSSIASQYERATLPFRTQRYHLSDIQSLRQDIASHPDEQFIVVGAGEQSVLPLASLSNMANVVTSWSGHQVPSNLNETTMAGIDTIHLPQSQTTHVMQHILGDRLVTTPHGVPVSKTFKTFEDAYHHERDALDIPPANQYLSIVLGGDAPTKEGEIRHYTAEEAYALGKWMGHHAVQTGAVVLATNGLNTGKYDPVTQQEIPDAHQVGAGLDGVSQSFLQGLQEAGVPVDKQRFFDCKHGQPTALNAMMGAALTHQGGFVVMPGESTSMLSEAVENFPPGRTISYMTQAMNNAQIKHNASLKGAGLIHQMDPLRSALYPNNYLAVQTPDRSADIVSAKIMETIQQKGMHMPISAPVPSASGFAVM